MKGTTEYRPNFQPLLSLTNFMVASMNQTSRAEAGYVYGGYYINRINNAEMMCCFRV